jgi:hypothetical protein
MTGLTMGQAGAILGLSRGQMIKRFNAEPELRMAFLGGYNDLRSRAIDALIRRLGADPDDEAVLDLLSGRACKLTASERNRLEGARASGRH